VLLVFRSSIRAHPPSPAIVEPRDPGDGHDLRYVRIRKDLGLWLAAGVLCAAAFLIPYRRSAAINFIDAWHPVQSLQRRLPAEAGKAFKEQMRAERRKAREGSVELDAYSQMRERLGKLDKDHKGDVPTLADIEAAIVVLPRPDGPIAPK